MAAWTPDQMSMAGVGGGGGGAASAATGSGLSSMMGPIGTVVGGGAGLYSDMEKRKQRKKEEAASRPRHRRLAQIQDALNAYRETKLAGQLALSQAAFSWADSLRL